MGMKNGGLNKLGEECGELVQVVCKANEVGGLHEPHWNMDLLGSFIKEAGDVLAAIEYVAAFYAVPMEEVRKRASEKSLLFYKWAAEPDAYPVL